MSVTSKWLYSCELVQINNDAQASSGYFPGAVPFLEYVLVVFFFALGTASTS